MTLHTYTNDKIDSISIYNYMLNAGFYQTLIIDKSINGISYRAHIDITPGDRDKTFSLFSSVKDAHEMFVKVSIDENKKYVFNPVSIQTEYGKKTFSGMIKALIGKSLDKTDKQSLMDFIRFCGAINGMNEVI